MSEKLLLIDGHSILNRSFYGLPDLTNSEGLHTNAVYGFLNILFRILEEEEPTYLTVAFDVKHPTFRHEMFAEYKGTRKPMPEELRMQVPLIKEVLQAMDIVTVEAKGYEADDILGTLAKRAERQGLEVTLLSGDRDLLQLATEHILIRLPKTSKGQTVIEDYHAAEVLERMGVKPEHIIDLKALMGDSADNIPGVPGIGEKMALSILQKFADIEEAFAHLEEIEPKRARTLLEKNYDMAVLSKKLATIKTDCPLEYEFEQAKIKNFYTPDAYQLMKRLEFKNILKRFEGDDMASPSLSLDMQVITTAKEADKAFQGIAKKEKELLGLCFIGEHAGNAAKKSARKKDGGQLSLFFSEEGADIVEEENEDYAFVALCVASIEAGKAKQYIFLPGEKLSHGELVQKLYALSLPFAVDGLKEQLHLVTPLQKLCGAHYPKEQNLFTREQKIMDVGLAAYLCNPMKDSYNYDDIARDYLGLTLPSYSEMMGKTDITEALQTRQEDFCKYAAYQAYVNREAAHVLEEELKEQDMFSLYQEIELPLVFHLYDMEMVGVQVNKQGLADMAELLSARASQLEQDIYDYVGEVFNINSPKQLGVILFEKLKLPFAKKTKTGYSTSADILEKLKSEDPIASMILEYRQLTKLHSTYAVGLANFIREDGRIHGTFNQTITATGRISSTDPNLQNIPIRMELGRQLRKVFVPKEDCVFLDADYSQIELRVLAHMSGDEHLIQAYRDKEDIHRSTASRVFHIPYEEVTEMDRRNAKAVNFGIVYGISSFGLGQDLNISKKEAEQYIQSYFATYHKVKVYLDGLVEEGKKSGKVRTMFGRVRPIPELSSSNFMQRSFGERVAMNSPIQGTAADIIKLAMIRVADRLQREKLASRIVLQVHDELLVETRIDEIDRVQRILEEEMQGAVKLSVPLEVDVGQGRDWYEAH